MGFNQLTPVVKNLLVINIIFYIGSAPLMKIFGMPWQSLALSYHPQGFQPFQLVTHIFMHANNMHLFFNLFAIFMFGPVLEVTWGAKRFLAYYFFTAFGATLLHTVITYITYGDFAQMPGLLGASGAVFGLLLGYGVYYPNNVIQLLIPPIPIKAKYFVMIYAGLELYLGIGNFNTGIAHFAHLGGALFGLVMIWYWRSGRRY